MKMNSIVALALYAFSVYGMSQPPPPPPATTPAPIVKQTPASDTLVQTAKDMAAEKSSFDTIRNQARSTVDASSKQLQDALKAKTDAMMTQLKADKKYAVQLAEIDTITKQMSDMSRGANDKFQKDTSPIQQKIATDNALIGGLIPIVKKENGFPDSTTFNVDTQKWEDKTTTKATPTK